MAKHLEHSNSSICNRCPIQRSHYNASRQKWAQALDNCVDPLQDANECAHLREYDDVLGLTLRTVDPFECVALLFFIDPTLQAILMDSFGGSAAFARLHPGGQFIVFIGGKAHPAIAVVIVVFD